MGNHLTINKFIRISSISPVHSGCCRLSMNSENYKITSIFLRFQKYEEFYQNSVFSAVKAISPNTENVDVSQRTFIHSNGKPTMPNNKNQKRDNNLCNKCLIFHSKKAYFKLKKPCNCLAWIDTNIPSFIFISLFIYLFPCQLFCQSIQHQCHLTIQSMISVYISRDRVKKLTTKP